MWKKNWKDSEKGRVNNEQAEFYVFFLFSREINFPLNSLIFQRLSAQPAEIKDCCLR